MIRWEDPLPYRMAADPSNQFLVKAVDFNSSFCLHPIDCGVE